MADTGAIDVDELRARVARQGNHVRELKKGGAERVRQATAGSISCFNVLFHVRFFVSLLAGGFVLCFGVPAWIVQEEIQAAVQELKRLREELEKVADDADVRRFPSALVLACLIRKNVWVWFAGACLAIEPREL